MNSRHVRESVQTSGYGRWNVMVRNSKKGNLTGQLGVGRGIMYNKVRKIVCSQVVKRVMERLES